jgi:hypothetical protein
VRAAGDNGEFPASVGGPDGGGTRGTDAAASVIKQFPLLAAARGRENAGLQRDKMLRLAGLPDELLDRFKAALQHRSTHDEAEKMITPADQDRLMKIFRPSVEARGGQNVAEWPDDTAEAFALRVRLGGQSVHLQPDHFEALKAAWPNDTAKAFAFRVLCMAALYTRSSSSHVFGVEENSPEALRFYAEALLRKAHELDPGLPPDTVFVDWVNRLKGTDDAFTCTAVLYYMQSQRLNAILSEETGDGPLHQVWNDMIPLEWR